MKYLAYLLSLMLIGFGSVANAQEDTLTAVERTAAITEIGQLIEANYFDASRGAALSVELDDLARSDALADVTSGTMLGAFLTEVLQKSDRHLNVRWRGVEAIAQTRAEWAAQEASNEAAPRPDDSMRRINYAFAGLSVLDGNVGYLNLTGFAPIETAEPTARAALNWLAHTDALIIDLRENGGGAPDMEQYLLSHFLPEGTDVLYATFLPRTGEPTEMHVLPHHPAGHRPHVPLYLLVGPDTLSAAEALAYHLQAMGRATVIGEPTAGGANPGDISLAYSGFSVFIPTATSRSAITGTNWEGTGVTPDIAVPVGVARDRALLEIYRHLAATSDVPAQVVTADWQAGLLAEQFDPWHPSAAELAAYAGQYGMLRISVEDDHLVYQREGRAPRALTPLFKDAFRFDDNLNYRIEFVGAETGSAEALVLRIANGAADRSPRSE